MTYLWSSEEDNDDVAGPARAARPAERRAWRRENSRPSIQNPPPRTIEEQPLPCAPRLHRPELKGVYRAILDSSSSSDGSSSDEGSDEGDGVFPMAERQGRRGPNYDTGAEGGPPATRSGAAVCAARRAAERQRHRMRATPEGAAPGTQQGERPPRERLGRAVREALWLHLVETAGREGKEGSSRNDQGVQVGYDEEDGEEELHFLQSRLRHLGSKEEEEEEQQEEEDQQLLEELFGLPSLSAQLESERSGFAAAVSAANRQLQQPSSHRAEALSDASTTPMMMMPEPLSSASASPRCSSKKKSKKEAAKGSGQRGPSGGRSSRSSKSKLEKAACAASASSASRHYRSPHQQQQQSKAAASPLGTLPPFRR